MADVKYTVVVDAKGATAEIKKFDESVRQLPGSSTKATVALNGMVAKFVGVAAGVALLNKGFGMFKGFMEDSVKAAMAQEEADRSLAAALELTGRAIPLESMKAFASSLQQQTRYEDDAIQGVQTLLVQMTRLDREGLDVATKGAIGLASVMKMDLQAAAMLVQKAMSGNVGALSRYGIQVDETLTKGEKQAVLLEKLSGLYQRAVADADTFAGKIEQLKNSFGDFQENVGDAVIKSESLNDILKLLKLTMDQLAGATDASSGPIGILGLAAEWVGNQLKTKFGPALALIALEQAKANAASAKLREEYDRGEELWKKMGWLPMEAAKAVEHFSKKTFKAAEDAKIFEKNLERLEAQFAELDDTMGEVFSPEFQVEMPAFIQSLVDAGAAASAAATEQANALKGLYDQVFGDIINNFTSIMDGTRSMGEVFSSTITTMIAGMGKLVVAQILMDKTSIKGSMMQSVARHIANIFKAVPFPLDIILAAGAFGVVSKLFAGLMKFQEGGVFKKPTIAEIGHGTEYVLPEQKLVNLMRAAVSGRPVGSAPAPAMAGGGMGGQTIYIYGPLLSVRELSDSNIRSAGDKLFAEVNRQARRLGRG